MNNKLREFLEKKKGVILKSINEVLCPNDSEKDKIKLAVGEYIDLNSDYKVFSFDNYFKKQASMDGLIFDYKNKEMELIEAKDFTVSFTKSDLDEYNVSNAVDDIFSDVSVDRSKTVINKETLSEKYITLISYLNCIEKKSEGSINALKDMCRSNRIRFCDFKVGKYLFLDTYSAINKDYYIFKYINLDIVIGDCIKYDLVNKSDDFNYIISRDKLYEILEKYKEVFNC